MGIVDNVVILEKESFEVLFTDHHDLFTLEKAVKLNLKDYHNKYVVIAKINRDGKSLLIISDHLTY